ncbi:hypothetical protein [Corallococcus macrosporus]|uniref:hypothetical protein n=1 Tax=Corallococcus macrosporus TaxID=35 RepID=UPI001EFC4110|nr:hypothetical protein [Corallococcus macrosporus]
MGGAGGGARPSSLSRSAPTPSGEKTGCSTALPLASTVRTRSGTTPSVSDST